MRKDRIQEFSLRVTQANRSELIVILYEIIEADIEHANDLFHAGDFTGYEKECRHALRVVNELMGALDYHYEISYELLSLYSFMNKSLVAALMKRDTKEFTAVLMILTRLKEAFKEVSRQDMSGAVMQNTQQIYAGLTYGRGTLNESAYSYQDVNRGFTV